MRPAGRGAQGCATGASIWVDEQGALRLQTVVLRAQAGFVW